MHTRLGSKRTGKSWLSSCLTSSVLSLSSPHEFLKRDCLPVIPFTASDRLPSSFCRPWSNMFILLKCPNMSARTHSRIWNWVSSLAIGRLMMWRSKAINLSRNEPANTGIKQNMLHQMRLNDSWIFEWGSRSQRISSSTAGRNLFLHIRHAGN